MKITKEQVDGAFEKTESVADVTIEMYRILYGDDWNRLDKVGGFPKCGADISKYIFDAVIVRQKKLNPEVLNCGGMWFNSGFSTDKNLNPWEVRKTGKEVYAYQSPILA